MTATISRLTVKGLVQDFDKWMKQAQTLSAVDALETIVNELGLYLGDRCCHTFLRGKRKDERCLKARLRGIKGNYVSNNCGGHTSNNLKAELRASGLLKSLSTADTADSSSNCGAAKQPKDPKSLNSGISTSGENANPKLADDHLSDVEWGKPSIPTSKSLINPYFLDPTKELQHLYDNFYIDNYNMIVLKNSNASLDHQWVLVCKFNRELGIPKPFSKSILNEMANQQEKQNYDYIIDQGYIGKIDPARVALALEDTQSQLQPKIVEAKIVENQVQSQVAQKETIKVDKTRDYNKYSRAPQIVLNEEKMNSEEFKLFYHKGLL